MCQKDVFLPAIVKRLIMWREFFLWGGAGTL
jgi:hypothetical protein